MAVNMDRKIEIPPGLLDAAKIAAKLAIRAAIDKSGLRDSVSARERRNRDSRLIDAPRAGTPLLVELAEMVEHSGVFLGRNRVAELNGNRRLLNVSLSAFLNGQPDSKVNMRWGTRVFAACDAESGSPLSSPKIARTARTFISQVGETDYNLFRNNCHLFTASCVSGILRDGLSWMDWIKDGTFSIARLEDMISQVMNEGRPIAWIGVREPSRSFNYALSDDKAERLRIEERGIGHNG